MLLLLVAALALCSRHLLAVNDVNSTSIKLAFGSCYGMHNLHTDIFRSILSDNPYAFIWLGDVAYLDQCKLPKCSLEYAHQQYNKTVNDPFYMQLARIGGVWDDHDYGIDNGGEEWQLKDEYRKIFLHYIEEPTSSERYSRKDDGIYAHYQFKLTSNYTIRLILLDNRYHNNHATDTLGEKQWNWLDNVLATTNDSVYLICSGIQILNYVLKPLETFDANSRYRLLQIVKKYRKSGVILITGDVHFAQFYKIIEDPFELGYDIHEMTTSGLTHTLYDHESLPVYKLKLVMNEYYFDSSFFVQYNYGTVEFTEFPDPTITMKLLDVDGKCLHNVTMKLNELQYKDVVNSHRDRAMANFNMTKFQRTFKKVIDNFFDVFSITFLISWGSLFIVLYLIAKIRDLVNMCSENKSKIN